MERCWTRTFVGIVAIGHGTSIARARERRAWDLVVETLLRLQGGDRDEPYR
jgi:hypothetical protein